MTPDRWPLPTAEVWNHPDYILLPPAGRGMLWSLLEAYWRSGCQPLPTDLGQLYVIARAHRTTWHDYRHVIARILADITPKIADVYRTKLRGLNQLRINARVNANARKAGAALQRLERAAASQAPSSPLLALPTRAPDPQRQPPPHKRHARPILTDK